MEIRHTDLENGGLSQTRDSSRWAPNTLAIGAPLAQKRDPGQGRRAYFWLAGWADG